LLSLDPLEENNFVRNFANDLLYLMREPDNHKTRGKDDEFKYKDGVEVDTIQLEQANQKVLMHLIIAGEKFKVMCAALDWFSGVSKLVNDPMLFHGFTASDLMKIIDEDDITMDKVQIIAQASWDVQFAAEKCIGWFAQDEESNSDPQASGNDF
jgi:hypothetical protein